MNKKVLLMILDGWGIAKNLKVSAIDNAQTPYINSLYRKYPHSKLEASGLAVGLPAGQMGNSEVGHMNIGAGRVVYQDLVRVNKAVEEKELDTNPVLVEALNYARNNYKAVHLIGLVSDGGVHSHIDHLKGLCTIAANQGIKNVFIHAFTDGRDCDPKSGLAFMIELQQHLNYSVGKIATVSGRYFAMDRDKRWERVKLAYDALVNGVGEKATDAIAAIENSYANNITDEFIKPTIVVDEGQQPLATIKNGDVALCFNFRTDRCREITQVLTQTGISEFGMHPLSLHYTTMTEYDHTYVHVNVIFETDNLNNTLGEILEKNSLKQIRTAETEKYPHVTFFFSGGREKVFEGETRIMMPSPKVATYDMQPEMSAIELTNALIPEIQSKSFDFCVLNYANTDMVGHTGVWSAAIKAAEIVDKCVERIVTTALQNGYTICRPHTGRAPTACSRA